MIPNLPAIVLVAFGASNLEGRALYDYVEASARARYAGHDLRWAFTSQTVANKLRRQGVAIGNLEESIRQLKADGYRQAVFQSLMLSPGEKNTELLEQRADELEIKIGEPLMANEADIEALADILAGEIKPGIPNVLVCHGNSKFEQYNRENLRLGEIMEARHETVLLCSLEGPPGTSKLARARELGMRSGAVHFIPVLLAPGGHILNDVMGEQAASWKTQVNAQVTTCSPTLGSHEKVLNMFFKHLDEALGKFSL